MKSRLFYSRWPWLRCSALLVAVGSFIALQLAAPGLTWTQESSSKPSISKIERKNRAPVSQDILKVTIPKPRETILPNGLKVLLFEDHRFPTVVVQFYIGGAGALFEPAALPGLANVTAHMLTEGTRTRTSKQIAEQVERLGATISASSGFG